MHMSREARGKQAALQYACDIATGRCKERSLTRTCFSFLPETELAKAGALVLKAFELAVMGEPGGTPCPLLMASATADCPGDPTAVAVWVPVATTAAHGTSIACNLSLSLCLVQSAMACFEQVNWCLSSVVGNVKVAACGRKTPAFSTSQDAALHSLWGVMQAIV